LLKGWYGKLKEARTFFLFTKEILVSDGHQLMK